jgi:hypothetical protein
MSKDVLILRQSAILRARTFNDAGQPVGAEARRQFVFQPIDAKVDGVLGSASPYTIAGAASVDLRCNPALKVHYTLDGMTPTKDSPVYEQPLAIKRDTIVTAQAFTSAGERMVEVWTGSFVYRGY